MGEKRMIHDYEVLHSIKLSGKELVFGETRNPDNEAYLCTYCEGTDLFEMYQDSMVGDNYLEMIELYANRLHELVDGAKQERASITVPLTPITAGQCYANDRSKSIDGEIVAVKADVLCGEYRTQDRQIHLVKGGFGANANARGRSVFAKNLYHNTSFEWRRDDILGVIKPEHLPAWAKERADIIKTMENKNKRVSEDVKPKKKRDDQER